MAKFLNPQKLIREIEDLFIDAENLLIIVSPFIKLDNHLKKMLSDKINDITFEVIILYGKNESERYKSLGENDLNFFKQFTNVKIYYNPDLHAKYYANDFRSIITSLNLHSYSISNNIEVGVLFERKGRLSMSSDNHQDEKSFEYFQQVFDESERIFIKDTQQKSSFFGLIKGEIKERIEVDMTSKQGVPKKDFDRFESKAQTKPIHKNHGYCIRTGEQIPFNMSRPLSKKGFDSWAQYSNEDYPEKFCHFSGEKTFGENTFSKPVLYKHYKKAAEIQNKMFK